MQSTFKIGCILSKFKTVIRLTDRIQHARDECARAEQELRDAEAVLAQFLETPDASAPVEWPDVATELKAAGKAVKTANLAKKLGISRKRLRELLAQVKYHGLGDSVGYGTWAHTAHIKAPEPVIAPVQPSQPLPAPVLDAPQANWLAQMVDASEDA